MLTPASVILSGMIAAVVIRKGFHGRCLSERLSWAGAHPIETVDPVAVAREPAPANNSRHMDDQQGGESKASIFVDGPKQLTSFFTF